MSDRLNYNNFLDILVNLPSEDIRSTCQVNRDWNKYCQQSTFWSDLIRRKYNYDTTSATWKDLAFIEKLFDEEEIPDDPIKAKIHRFLIDQEINAYLDRRPLRHFILITEDMPVQGIDMSGVVWTGYSKEGAILKMYVNIAFLDGRDFYDYLFELHPNISQDEIEEEIEDFTLMRELRRFRIF